MYKTKVKFKDGTYGIRKGIIKYSYFDFRTKRIFWWSINSEHFLESCKTSKEIIDKAWIVMHDEGIPYK